MEIWMQVVIGLWLLVGIILGGCYFYATNGVAKDMRGPYVLNYIVWVILGIVVVVGGFLSLLAVILAAIGPLFPEEERAVNGT